MESNNIRYTIFIINEDKWKLDYSRFRKETIQFSRFEKRPTHAGVTVRGIVGKVLSLWTVSLECPPHSSDVTVSSLLREQCYYIIPCLVKPVRVAFH
jgi:hypothetical protein